METYRIKKGVLNRFLGDILKSRELVAPKETDAVRFSRIEKPEDVSLERSYTPAKEFFFGKNEIIITFKGNKITKPIIKSAKRVMFGLRKCDLNAIKKQDIIFKDDDIYKARRKNTILIGLHCNIPPTKYCFCYNLEDCFDLMFYDILEYYYIEVGSDLGKTLVKPYFQKTRMLTQEERKIRYTDRLKVTDISKFYDHPLWNKLSEECLSCGACTTLCPTCYCSELHDTLNTRCRLWSSCQVLGFTRVAGDHIFRQERVHRFKHRIYHQLDYFKQKYGTNLCVGCGRCIESCPTTIDFVEALNKMKNGTNT